MYFGNYDIYIECDYMFIPLFKPKNTLIINFIYDIGLVLFDDIQVKKQIDNWRKKLPLSIKNSDLLITISKSSKKDIENYLVDIGQSHKKIEFIYANSNPLAPCTTEYKDVQKKFSLYGDYFLFIGTLEPRKNPLRLVESFHLFKQKTQSDIKLVFAGKKGWLYQDVLDYVETNKLEKEVLFTGYISEEEKVILLKHTKAFLFFSRYEGFGIPPLEALRLGVPTFLSDIPVFRELFGENVHYAKIDDINEIVMQMEDILDNPKQIDMTSLEKFSWEASAFKLIEILYNYMDVRKKG
jgi:glycosyltransferase involved in cell wall biosynthesis